MRVRIHAISLLLIGSAYPIAEAGNDYIYDGVGNGRIYGGDGNDYLNSESGNDASSGGQGSDNINGGSGDDTIGGVDNIASRPEANIQRNLSNDRDTLTGGSGADTSVIGVRGNLFYDSNGGNDVAYIEDFKSGRDVIQLSGSATDYIFASNSSDTYIYTDPVVGGVEEDLIAIVKNNTNLDISSNYVFV